MINAKAEFIEHIKDRSVICFDIEYEENYDGRQRFYYNSNIHTLFDLDSILEELNFDYDNGYGHQYIYGKIWYQDGTWSTRYEYDGSETWEHHVCPPLPSPPVTNWPFEIKKFLKAVGWTQHGSKATTCVMELKDNNHPVHMGTDNFRKLENLLKQSEQV
jgi:hypothetical protein